MADWKQKQRFTEQDMDQIDDLLSDLRSLVDVCWHWDEDGCLVVEGLDDQPVTFSNWRSAKAGLEMFRRGWEMAMANEV